MYNCITKYCRMQTLEISEKKKVTAHYNVQLCQATCITSKELLNTGTIVLLILLFPFCRTYVPWYGNLHTVNAFILAVTLFRKNQLSDFFPNFYFFVGSILTR